MHEETVGSKVVKWLLIGISALFLIVMLLLPLITVISEALRSGWETYLKAVTDRYTIKAIFLTLEATICAVLINTIFGVFAAWAVTKFHFKGKKLLTTLIDVPVTISPVIAGLIFVLTFGRQSFLYPYLQQLGIQVVFAVPGIVLAIIPEFDLQVFQSPSGRDFQRVLPAASRGSHNGHKLAVLHGEVHTVKGAGNVRLCAIILFQVNSL